MSSNTIRKNIELNKDTVDWFYSTYPDANLSAILSMMFDKFRALTEHTPEYYAQLAAESMKEELG